MQTLLTLAPFVFVFGFFALLAVVHERSPVVRARREREIRRLER